jgi:hypothetical protein
MFQSRFMTGTIDTLGRAGRHRMLVVAECRLCGREAKFYAEELAVFYGRGRDPQTLKFRCKPCDSVQCKITLIEQSFERKREMIVWRPVRVKEG